MTKKETKQRDMYDFNTLELIQLKKKALTSLESKYFDLLELERKLKACENQLWLETDFKAQGLTNDKMRSAFVSSKTSSLRFDRDYAKYCYKQQENIVTIIDELIQYRGGEK